MHRLFLFCVLVLFAIGTSLFVLHNPLDVIRVGTFHTIDTYGEEQQKPSAIRFVGDVMLARNVESLIKSYKETYPFANVQLRSTSSLLVGNFEAAIPEKHIHTPDFTFAFSVDASLVPLLHKNGFSHMSLANNHSLDFGTPALEHTQKTLSEASIIPFGTPDNTQVEPVEISLKETDLLVRALNVVDDVPTEAELAAYFNNQNDEVVSVVYVHWGTEYALEHNTMQETLAHTLIDTYGVDVIIGHHPHVVQDIELYNNAVIFYSLGNFLFDQYFNNDVQEGLLLALQVENQQLRIVLEPYSSVGSLSAPYKMGQYETDVFLEKLQTKSSTELTSMIEQGEIIIDLE